MMTKRISNDFKKEKNEVAINAENRAKISSLNTDYVIDASITGIKDIENFLSQLCETNAKIILTSVTLKELENLQKFHDAQAKDARHILAMAAENPQSFHPVLIDETIGIPDDCIIKYCADNNNRVSLLTSDKMMALKARMYNIETQYLKQEATPTAVTAYPTVFSTQPNYPDRSNYLGDNTATLSIVEKTGNKLYIDVFNNSHGGVLLISGNLEYTSGVHELKIGDSVYLATKKDEYITFAHYQITSLSLWNNSRLIYSKRIYKKDKIRYLPSTSYRSFMYGFMQRHDL